MTGSFTISGYTPIRVQLLRHPDHARHTGTQPLGGVPFSRFRVIVIRNTFLGMIISGDCGLIGSSNNGGAGIANSANEPWKIEQNGINVVSEQDRKGTPYDLFWVWFGANLGILGVLYGGVIVSFQLGMAASIMAAAIGALSFVLVGLLSIPGRDGGAPMLALSRRVFGHRGNLLPTFVSWINLLGWETVAVITGSLGVQALLETVFHAPLDRTTMVVGVILFAGCALAFGLLGQATLVIVQKWIAWVFGLTTGMIVLLLLHGVGMGTPIVTTHTAWLPRFLAAVSIIVAGTSISWGNAAADFSRYTKRTASSRSIVMAVTLGAAIPLFLLMVAGILMVQHAPLFMTSANPIAAIEAGLPPWMRVVYLLTVVGGLVAEADLSLYSSGLNLLTMGIRIKRYKTIMVDAIVMISVTVYVLIFQQQWISQLEAFVTLFGVGLAAWEAVFLADMLVLSLRSRNGLDDHRIRTRHQIHIWSLLSWAIGIGVGLLYTNAWLWNGPLAKGWFADSSLGVILTFGISFLLYMAGSVVVPPSMKRIEKGEFE